MFTLFYRLFNPKNPKAWLTIHKEMEGNSNPPTFWVHTHGMEKFKLTNLEITAVPENLLSVAEEILFALADYAKNRGPLRPSQNFGGKLKNQEQSAVHYTTLHEIKRSDDASHRSYLRAVDIYKPKDAGFPFQLFAAHLIETAENLTNAVQREQLYRQAIAIFPGIPIAPHPDDLYERGTNTNNHLSWYGLGDALWEQGKFDQGLACLEEAVARCPAFAMKFAQKIKEALKNKPPETDPRYQFWLNLNVDEVCQRLISRCS